MDREEMFRLVGRRVVVGFDVAGAGGVEMTATLDEINDDGVVLSQISDLVPGPTLFCPWESFRRARDRLPWFVTPGEEPGLEEELQLRPAKLPGIPHEETTSERIPEHR